MLDELQVFITYRPAWVGKDGFPLTWQHYVYGLRHIAREHLRYQLMLSQAMRMGRSDIEDWNTWQRDVSSLTEVPKHG